MRAEPLLVGELLRNLIENAIAYAGRGAVVTVRTLRAEHGIRLEVEDDGPGIPPDRRAVLLTRFARGERSGSGGSGLGLPIVEEIAGLYQARVTLSSGINDRGLKVTVLFPAVEQGSSTAQA